MTRLLTCLFFLYMSNLFQRIIRNFAVQKTIVFTNHKQSKMKKILYFVLTFVFTMLPVNSFASSSSNETDQVPLIPISGEEDDHRGPYYLPIQCYYSNGELTFTFSADLGTVDCEVVRLSDETVYEATFYAINGGSDSLYVSTAPDDYVITLTCADGTIYYGEYSIE